MNWTLLVPALVPLGCAGLVSCLHRRLPPRAATWLLTSLLLGCGFALLWAAIAVFSGFLAAQPITGQLFGWCRHVVHRHEHVPAAAGVGAGVLLLTMGLGISQSVRRYRRLCSDGGSPLEILATAEPIAVTLPGRRPRILISTGMLDCLDPRQRDVLYAHERAHAQYRHHRFLLAGDLVASAVPFLRPVAKQLSHAIERWADEEAALAVGDRRLVATAIAQAALAVTDHTGGLLAMAGGSVPERVRALLAPQRPEGFAAAWSAIASVTVGLAAVSSTVQLHHLVTVSQHLC